VDLGVGVGCGPAWCVGVRGFLCLGVKWGGRGLGLKSWVVVGLWCLCGLVCWVSSWGGKVTVKVVLCGVWWLAQVVGKVLGCVGLGVC